MKQVKGLLALLMLFLLLFFFATGIVCVKGADDWSMYRGDLQRSGCSNSTGSNGLLLWQFSTGDKIRSSAAVVDGVVYVGSNNDVFYALDAVSGGVVWQVNLGSNLESSPAVVDGVVYVGVLWNGISGFVDTIKH